ncbi:hypothetical protein JKP88DRAFT_350454 [Tribonema minus]|uniref:Uncharacterized protein n=1 Tax=Tribonema minus TaxID=303371 RepID=A0A835YMR0_9STRA|nr:hypothetical protein JKP88DRAFT_350454 [Tribonema minus]|eukprot:TRINITY_DN2793_c0_g1_i1.p1 TRINITY_DN2793_c0_g1~~TRINITY_DN2793_c0_g1_i1.p1  ORF type:complete len:254 (-),score=71.26 TRINITY_DN2793_c0_g1_i1:45-806(-)
MSAKRAAAEAAAAENEGGVDVKRLKRTLTQESDVKIYETNIHETMKTFPTLRECRRQDYNRCITLFALADHARDRRNKVFAFFNSHVSQPNSFQTDEVFRVSEEVLSVLDESREQLELVTNWCDLCLPANETAFAEAHRLKLQDFQDYLSGGVTGIVNSINEVNSQLEKRAQTLQLLFTTKDVLPENRTGWIRAHRDLLVHSETNAYLQVAKIWEKVLEDYVLYYNYWKTNIKDGDLAFGNQGKSERGSDYFG